MRTHLFNAGDIFSVTLRIPLRARLDYAFMVAAKKGAGGTNVWKNESDAAGRPFTKEVTSDGRIEVQSAVTSALPVTAEQRKAWLAGDATDIPLVTQTIVYDAATAGEVWLVWGLDGWQRVPVAARPPGTKIKDDELMHTPMVRAKHAFAAKLKLPPGTRLNYRFLITRTEAGAAVHHSEDGEERAYLVPTSDQVRSSGMPVSNEQRKQWLAGKGTNVSLVGQELSYSSVLQREVKLLWGIEGWQAVPEAARPPGTTVRNGLMYSPMVQHGTTFSATVQVPSGTTINYQFLIDVPTAHEVTDKSRLGMLLAQIDGRLDVQSAATKALLEQHKAWPSGPLDQLSLFAQEIRCRIGGADEVWLVWGINGWQAIPDEARPPDTVIKDQVMPSRMVRHGDTFTTNLRVPPGTVLDYAFLITKTSRGAPVNIRQDLNGRDYRKLVRVPGSLEEKSTVTVVTPEQRNAWLAGNAADILLVTHEIRYHAPGASEVWLAWGLDGWQTVPEAVRPPGTVLKENGVQQSPMRRQGDLFILPIQMPPGALLDYFFVIAKTSEGETVSIKQEKDKNGGAFPRLVMFDGQVSVESTAWISVQATELPLVTQEFRYRIAGADEVWLLWGINGWQPIPREARPPGTVLNSNRLLQSRMVRHGDTFVITVRVPQGAMLQYKYLITKTSRGVPIHIWQDLDGEGFQKRVRVSGTREEKATVTVVTPEQRKAWLAGQATDLPLVTQEILYRAPRATEVGVLWGLEGWQPAPEAARPPGTVLKDKLLRSRMVRKGDSFTATLQVPPGTQLDFRLLITKTEGGKPVEMQQENDEAGRTLSRVVMFDGQIQIRAE